MFDLDQFVADLRASLKERSRATMKEVVARAISDPESLVRQFEETEEGAIKVLHRARDLTVLNVLWAPHQVTLPHNHLLAAAIGMYSGREDNMFWRRVPVPGKFQIEAAGGSALGPGDVILLGRDAIHSVVNPLTKCSGAIHVYEGDFFAVERSMWDAETLAEAPYDLSKVAGRPIQTH